MPPKIASGARIWLLGFAKLACQGIRPFLQTTADRSKSLQGWERESCGLQEGDIAISIVSVGTASWIQPYQPEVEISFNLEEYHHVTSSSCKVNQMYPVLTFFTHLQAGTKRQGLFCSTKPCSRRYHGYLHSSKIESFILNIWRLLSNVEGRTKASKGGTVFSAQI